MGKRRGRCVRKNATANYKLEPEHLTKAPHSFVIHRGDCDKDLIDLTRDFRKVMEPYTAAQLKEKKTNTIKDFVSVSGYFHVSHLCMFTETGHGSYLRLARLPRGPTLSFRVHDYCLMRDVVSNLKKQFVTHKAFQNPPLIVLNSFSGEGMHMKLMANMFQNMFPTININSVQLKNIQRCVLLNYSPTTKLIDFRHYIIKATPVGLNKGTKKVIQGKIPDLSRCKDISEFFDKTAVQSESEMDEDPNSQVVLPQKLPSRGSAVDTKSALRLFEVGPRMSLQLIKVEDGLMEGEVLYHELVHKTQEEKEYISKKREEKRKLKEKRKKVQSDNLKRKAVVKEELKQKSLEGIKKKMEVTEHQRLKKLAEAETENFHTESKDDEDDDAQYYRQEVGQEPENDLFDDKNTRKRKHNESEESDGKKMRLDKRYKKLQTGNREKNDKPEGKFKKNLTVGGRFNKDRRNNQKDGRRSEGRGGNPKYGWKAQSNEEESTNHRNKGNNFKNKSFGSKGKPGKPARKGGKVFSSKGKKGFGSKMKGKGKK